MKIAVLSAHTPSLFWFRMDMMKEFQARGCEVIAIGNEDESEWKQKFSELGIRYIQAVLSRNGMNPLSELRSLRSLFSILKQERPDKLFTYQAKTVIYGGIAAKRLGISEVYPLIAGLGSVFLSEKLSMKAVRAVLKTEYRLALKSAKKVFFQNEDDKAFFIEHHLTDSRKAVMIPGSGVNLSYFTPLPLPEKLSFLMIARLIRDKGVYEYLEACRAIKKQRSDVRCLLVGPYDTNPTSLKPAELEEFVADGSIEYFGEQDDVRPYIGMSSVFVLPSYREGTPKTNLEAMACGRGIITTNAPGCRETVCEGYNGFMVDVKNVDAIVEKMLYLYDHPEVVTEIGKNSLSFVRKFDVNHVNSIVCRTMELPEKLISV